MGAAAGAIVSGIFNIVGGVIGAQAEREKGAAQARALRFQAQVAANNKIIADQNATWEMQAGRVKSEAIGMQTRTAVSSAKANIAAGGIDVNTGSALDVQSTIAGMGAQDSATTIDNAAKEAYGWRAKGVEQAVNRKLLLAQADDAERLGQINALGSILGGVGSAVGGVVSAWDTNRATSSRTNSRSNSSGLVLA